MSRIYQKGEVLGVGTFATVYSGWDQLLDRAVAIKELRQPFAADEGFVRAFLSRALEMLDLGHDHLLATYAADSSQHPPAIVRELADETLEAVAIASPLAPGEVEEILRHAIAGLGALHCRGVAHGAIKPQNLFRSGERYKLGDYAVPPPPEGPPSPPRECRYAAPEVVRRETAGGPAADLYSLGLVVCELLLGQIGFERLGEGLVRQAGLAAEGDVPPTGDEIWALLNASKVEIPPPHELIRGVSMALSLTIHQMTRKELGERSASVEAVLTNLGAAGTAGEVADSPPPVAPGAHPGSALHAGLRARSGSGAQTVLGTSAGAGGQPESSPFLASAGHHASRAGTVLPARLARAVDPGDGPPSRPRSAARQAPQGAFRGGGMSARQAPKRSLLLVACVLAAGFAALAFTGLGWLFAGHNPFAGRPRTMVPATLPCPSTGFEGASDAGALVQGLRVLAPGGPGLAIELDPPRDGSPARLTLGTPLAFRLTSDRPGHFALFVISSDGSITRFYPNSWQPDLTISAPHGGSLVLPSDPERHAGFVLRADRPLGRDVVFALRSATPLLPPAVGRRSSDFTRDYALADGTAGAFASWAARLRCEHPTEAALALREIDVVAAR